MKKNIRIISFIVIGLVCGIAFAYQAGWFASKGAKTEDKAATAGSGGQKSSPPQPIKAYVVKEEVLEDKITAVGSIASNEEVALACETAGKITKILFEEGSNVSKGQLHN
jgi:membrane fusion protein, multidrug efflux system